jgi:cell division protein FtsQ
MQRLWLTPSVRRLLRLGLPLMVLVASASWTFTQPQNLATLGKMYSDVRRSIAERPEFMIEVMTINGASEELSADIREVLTMDFPISSFDLDLEGMQQMVVGLDAVAAADLRVKPGGVLQLDVTERVPAVVWRSGDMLELLDREGHRVSALERRTLRADLPLIAGEGAEQRVPEALTLLASAAPVAGRMRGLVLMGERRWDLVLDRDQRIQLPAENPVPALEQVIALDQAQELLGRDVSVVDMRNPHRPTLRMNAPAVETLYRIKGIELGDILQ